MNIFGNILKHYLRYLCLGAFEVETKTSKNANTQLLGTFLFQFSKKPKFGKIQIIVSWLIRN